jgi:hypothetical protein
MLDRRLFAARRGVLVVRAVVAAFLADVVLVIVFAAIGRASHDEGVLGPGGTGLVETSWPFLVALVLGWLVTLAWRRPFAPLRTGLGVWVVTVAGGMLLRAVSGQGTALAFIVVASATLLLLLVGWRAVVALVARARARTTRTEG